MIKGINKQIVEINQTNNDYIEKAILIINPNFANCPKSDIDRNAKMYLQNLIEDSKGIKKSKVDYLKFAVISLSSILAGGMIVFFISGFAFS